MATSTHHAGGPCGWLARRSARLSMVRAAVMAALAQVQQGIQPDQSEEVAAHGHSHTGWRGVNGSQRG
jgi:hypothetical protein